MNENQRENLLVLIVLTLNLFSYQLYIEAWDKYKTKGLVIVFFIILAMQFGILNAVSRIKAKEKFDVLDLSIHVQIIGSVGLFIISIMALVILRQKYDVMTRVVFIMMSIISVIVAMSLNSLLKSK